MRGRADRPVTPRGDGTRGAAWKKHHIFPQAQDLAPFFKRNGINIHEYTMPIPLHIHRRIHGQGPDGGMWNEAWRQFIQGPGQTASREDIYKHVGVLLYRFELTGPVVPYYRQLR